MLKLYSEILQYLAEFRSYALDDKVLDIRPAIEFVTFLTGNPEHIEQYYISTLQSNPNEDFFLSHQANALAYALKIGRGLKYAPEKLHELGLAALHYDVGLLKIPDSIKYKEGELSDLELKTIQTHAEVGSIILSAYQEQYPFLSRAALEHHEREMGQGYPSGLKGNEISEYSKIIGVVDIYEAMIHKRPYRKAYLQHDSIKRILNSKGQLFPPYIIKAHLEETGLYPLGSYVKLNNGVTGRVCAVNKSHPLKPVVILLFDSNGLKMAGDSKINLGEHPILYITEAIDMENLPYSR